jgi:hypothetical protein
VRNFCSKSDLDVDNFMSHYCIISNSGARGRPSINIHLSGINFECPECFPLVVGALKKE